MLRSELAARSGLRRRFVSASTLDHRYAAYHDAWRRVVERTVSRNYPAEAKEKKLAGSLVLHVAIRSDGSATETRIVRSSGYQALDKAALYVIRMAEPFAPFSDAIRKETDMIDIASVWHFRLGDE
ncbi:MAG: energy transducer TonB [Sedimenticola sp.]